VIYLDSHATTPVDPRVLEAMLPYFTEHFGNPSSKSHSYGWKAQEAVEHARQQVADLVGANVKEIILTSGATESNNLAIQGIARGCRDRGDHVVTVATEHKAVLDTCQSLEAEGVRVTYLGVRPDGLIDLDDLRRAITERTVLVSVMAANNEIGVIQPIAEIGAIARAVGAVFHTDAVQAAGKVPFDVNAMNVDLASLTAHKIYGPKGAGALFVRRRDARIRMAPLLHGGGQERGLRAGTLNVPGIVGLGKAAEICRLEMAAESVRLRALRDRLHDGIRAAVPDVHVNGSMEHRLPQNLNIAFAGVEAESLLLGLGDVAVSPGAACASGSAELSHVLKALSIPDRFAHSSIRFGIGRFTTEAEIDYVVSKLAGVVARLREMSPTWVPS
jgi:cysteine desulfurase